MTGLQFNLRPAIADRFEALWHEIHALGYGGDIGATHLWPHAAVAGILLVQTTPGHVVCVRLDVGSTWQLDVVDVGAA